jgi:photosystem II stability/assembly factor-like uncharacterized protein
MKRILFFIFALQLFISVNIYSQQSGWVWQNPLPQGNDIYYVKMFNSGTGYSSTPYHLLKTTNYGTNWNIILEKDGIGLIYFINESIGINSIGNIIYKTTNGGINWYTIYTFTDFYVSLFNWQNETSGFALQNSPSNVPIYYKSKIYKTTNGGSAWQMVFNDTTININSISFPSAIVGYMAGITKNDPIRSGKFFKTTNQGLTWDSISIIRLRDLQSTYFTDNNSGYVSGIRMSTNGPNMLRTTNGGTSWDSIYYGATRLLHFVNFNTGYGNEPFRKTTNSGLNWITLNPYSEAGLNLRCFSIFGTENIYLGGAQGDLGKSTDGGITWAADSKGFNGNLFSIQFFDANTGIAAGSNNGAMYLRTTNSGATWDTIRLTGEYLEKIYLANSNTAYIASNNRVHKTTNKGESFTTYNTISGASWSDVSFPNENTGYTINKYRVMDKTTNGGDTWVNISPITSGEYFTLCFINGNTGFFAGSKIYKTTNGGVFWDTVITGLQTGSFINKIRYINNKIYAVGYTYSSFNGLILTSTNEGISWQIDTIANSNGLHDISIPEPNVIWVIGYNNYVYKSIKNSAWSMHNIFTQAGYLGSISFINKDTGFISTNYGGILKTTNGGGTPIGINLQSNEIPTAFNLYQNYPNPFNPTTIIEYSLPKSSLVTIKIYDLLGRLVKQIVNENQPAGNYSVNFDGSIYASGVYFYRLETDDLIISKKMVLIK